METRLYACASRIFARSRARVGEAATQEVFGSWLIARDTESGGTSKTSAGCGDKGADGESASRTLSEFFSLFPSFFLPLGVSGVPRSSLPLRAGIPRRFS